MKFLVLNYYVAGKNIKIMHNEDRIVELLAEMLIRQDIFIDELRNSKSELAGVNQRLAEHSEILVRHERLLERNDYQTQRILELLSEDVICFDEVLNAEQLEQGKRIVLHKRKYASNLYLSKAWPGT